MTIIKLQCSFCSNYSKDRKAIITMNGYNICNECIADCEEMLYEGLDEIPESRNYPIYEKVKEFDNVYKITAKIIKSK